jgi:hypothetical protein
VTAYINNLLSRLIIFIFIFYYKVVLGVVMKSMSKVALLTGALALAAVPAKAQIDAYSSTRINENPRNEITLNYTPNRMLRFGYNNVLTEQDPDHTFATQFTHNGTKIYAFVHEGERDETDAEIKMHQDIGPIKADLGVGSDDLIHLGIEHGGGTPNGFSICYVESKDGDKKEHERRTQVWRYFDELGLLASIRASNQNIAILASQINPLFATRLDYTEDLENGSTYARALIGHRGQDLYSIEPLADGKFSLRDPVFKSDADHPSIVATNPFRYLGPAFGWRVRDWGLRLQRNETRGVVTNEAEGVAYLNYLFWLSANIRRSNDSNTYGVQMGETGKRVSTAIGTNYNIESNESTITFMVRALF